MLMVSFGKVKKSIYVRSLNVFILKM